ncbi:hypothetical protein J6590_060435 [Homalodisca vitripennis]|nr:hypothetical protein J6590_060435 [Homalodisca vitripennis]
MLVSHRGGLYLNRRGTSMLNRIFMKVVSLCDNIYSKATGLNSQGSSDSHDQTANVKTVIYENFNEEASVLPPNHLSLQYPPLLPPDTSTSYHLQLDDYSDETFGGSLPGQYYERGWRCLTSTSAECKVQCQKVVNNAVLSVPKFVPQVYVSEDCNKDKSNSSSVFLDSRHVKLIPV